MATSSLSVKPSQRITRTREREPTADLDWQALARRPPRSTGRRLLTVASTHLTLSPPRLHQCKARQPLRPKSLPTSIKVDSSRLRRLTLSLSDNSSTSRIRRRRTRILLSSRRPCRTIRAWRRPTGRTRRRERADCSITHPVGMTCMVCRGIERGEQRLAKLSVRLRRRDGRWI